MYEIPLSKLLVGLMLLAYGTVVGVVGLFILSVFKVIPLLVVLNFEFSKIFKLHNLYAWWLFIVAWVLMNGLFPPLLIITAVVGGAAQGPYAAYTALQLDR